MYDSKLKKAIELRLSRGGVNASINSGNLLRKGHVKRGIVPTQYSHLFSVQISPSVQWTVVNENSLDSLAMRTVADPLIQTCLDCPTTID
ncbi:hypothetical protein T265_03652 [Opisthorchis viverrini]|uniref:Uncharacterized protein n=1 Tax=Opisthorchis viverrini TaxID=6198 RepID=A0A075A2I4_OPIVI|nr:hypothetical protein T265_03652 [Opisthorchis viverrini]KER29740.1 hypothetical protein T265_03652 [Opisthorchis viverrini]